MDRSGPYSPYGQPDPHTPGQTAPQASQQTAARSPFEEPADAPELRSQRSDDLYRRASPFWSPVADSGEKPRVPRRPDSYWEHPERLDQSQLMTVDGLSPGKKALRFLGSGTARAIAAAAVILCIAALILNSALMEIHQITVVGAELFSEEEIIRLSGLEIGQSTWNLDDEAVMHRIQSNRYLRCTLVDVQLDKVTIHIKERVPVAYIRTQGISVIMDNRGFVLEEEFSTDLDLSHLVQVSGMDVRQSRVGLTLIMRNESQLEVYEQILIELAAMSDREIPSALDMAEMDSITMVTRDGFTVRLGNEDMLHEKLRAFLITRDRVKEMGYSGGAIDVSNPIRPTFLPQELMDKPDPQTETAPEMGASGHKMRKSASLSRQKRENACNLPAKRL